eukprot:5917583-Pleurochrysis_carterae.AAC.1
MRMAFDPRSRCARLRALARIDAAEAAACLCVCLCARAWPHQPHALYMWLAARIPDSLKTSLIFDMHKKVRAIARTRRPVVAARFARNARATRGARS